MPRMFMDATRSRYVRVPLQGVVEGRMGTIVAVGPTPDIQQVFPGQPGDEGGGAEDHEIEDRHDDEGLDHTDPVGDPLPALPEGREKLHGLLRAEWMAPADSPAS